jgi:predicted dithiol-disulfide oxidoreductase (DUF899 family)
MQHRIVSRDEWLAARKAHLRSEKTLTRMRDLVAAERRTLPWVKVEKEYVFDTPHGRKTLADRFDGRSQLIQHFHVRPELIENSGHYVADEQAEALAALIERYASM